MDQALAAIVGAAMGAAGAAGAAAVTGWSTRWGVRTQGALQQGQWRRQVRRDAYSAFLVAGAQAREGLSAVWHALRETSPHLGEVEQQLLSARSLVHGVQRAGSVVALEGPDEILQPAREVEESLAVLYANLRLLHKQAVDNGDRALVEKRCVRQRAEVRERLDGFSQSARRIFDQAAGQEGAVDGGR